MSTGTNTGASEPTSVADPADPNLQPTRGAGDSSPLLLPDNAGTSVETDNPWLGLASFTEDTRAFFFGREQEITELERCVRRRLLTVLFGKSGLGKTSILQAGLVPGLRARGCFPVYLRIDYGQGSPEASEQIEQAINRAAEVAAAAGGVGGIDPKESIWEFLHRRDAVLQDASGEALIPLLIFDQFEELFTLAQGDEFGRARAARFVEELADLVENRPPRVLEARLEADEGIAARFDFFRSDYRVVICLREDYLAPLEGLRRQMPSLSENRLRLAPMTGTQALEAVLLPGNRLRPGKPLVSGEVAEAIVRFVAGGAEVPNAEVEPSLLSLICRELNEQRIAQHHGEISLDLLAGSRDSILSHFYERALAGQPHAVRYLIEDELLTESGFRENLAEESLLRRLQAAGAADALTTLVNRRLLRIEERLDVRRVEFTHDVLTGVVKISRDQRHEREAREATARTLGEQRERESAARRALRRARIIAAGCTGLAAAAVIAAILAVVNVQRARLAEANARQTRQISEQARVQAEGLLGFLTDDLVNELATFGRYQVVAELSQREIDYFGALPASLKDPQAVRNVGLALVNHATAVNALGNAEAADKDTTQAVALLEQLRRNGDRSDSTLRILGHAYTWMGWVNGIRGAPEAHADGMRAADLLRPIAARTDPSMQAYIEALSFIAWWGEQRGHDEEAARAGREAMQRVRQLRARRPDDVTVAADYAQTGAWLVSALANLGLDQEAHQVGVRALAVARQVLAQRPQYGAVLVGEQILERNLAEVAHNELSPAEGVRMATQGVQTSLTLVAVEPGNDLYIGNLGYLYLQLTEDLWSAGRLQESITDGRRTMETYGRAGALGRVAVAAMADAMASTAYRQAQLGETAAAAATVTAADAFTGISPLRKLGLAGAYTQQFIEALRAYPAAALAYERDDFQASRRIARAALAQLPAAPARDAFETGAMNDALCRVSALEGRAEYRLGDFAAAAQTQRRALQACTGSPVAGQRDRAQVATWLSMALAAQGKRAEAARTIAPVVTMYRALAARNHGDQWVPLELAAALYAQSRADDAHRAALLREAAQRMEHLAPVIAGLHDTRAWRARIAATQN